MKALHPDAEIIKGSEESGDKYLEGRVKSDQLIWEEFKKGSQSALTYIYRNYVNALYNYGCQFTSDKELIRDTVQDLFIDIIHSRSGLGTTTSIKFYLFRSLRNKLVRVLKKNNKLLAEDFIRPGAFEVTLSPENLLINSQLDEEKRRLLQTKINQLPALQKEALLLYFYEGMNYNQISEILNIKIKSTRALIYRAVESLGKLVKPFRNSLWVLLMTALLKIPLI